jgi:hypothetical protein
VSSSPQSRPTVLLGALEPIFEVGMARALREGGADVINDGQCGGDGLVLQAADSLPDAIVLGDGLGTPSDLRDRLGVAAPHATIVLWRSDAIVLIAPGSDDPPRVMAAPTPKQLLIELFGHSGKGASCPST